MKRTALRPGAVAAVRRIAVGGGFAVAIVVVLLWLAGVFAPKIQVPAERAAAPRGRPLAGDVLVAARRIRRPAAESAVGTIRAVREATVASKLLAKVTDVRVRAGQYVQAGDLLVKLDDEDLRARVDQAEAAVREAEAARNQAQIELDRVLDLAAQNVAARVELDQAETSVKTTTARLEAARQAAREAATLLGYATIVSPMDGIVVDKRIDVGDTVTPGQALVSLYDPTHMQLVASVRESLVHRLATGQTVDVHVDALGRTCQGQVSEIVPESDIASRSFAVKVTGPCPPEIHSGMFGRLLIPLDEEELLVVPRAAIRQVGQLSIVDVAADDAPHLQRRVVQLGRTVGDDVEVLAGLRAGEQVAVPPAAGTPAARG